VQQRVVGYRCHNQLGWVGTWDGLCRAGFTACMCQAIANALNT